MTNDELETVPPRTSSSTAAWLTAAVVMVFLAGGYVGFRIAAGLDLADQVGAGVIALAVVTGAAVVFSPCSFPLLVTLLGGSDRHEMLKDRRSDGLRSALAIAAGAAIFLLLAGLAVGVAGEGVASAVNFSSTGGRLLRGGVAAVLVGAGLIQLGVIQAPLSRVTVVAGPLERHRLAVAGSHRRRSQAIYGFAFVLAGFGWTGPLFAGLASQAATSGGFAAGVVAFAAAAVTLTMTLAGLALAASTLTDHELQGMRTQGPRIKRTGGLLLIAIGIWFAYLAAANPTYLLP